MTMLISAFTPVFPALHFPGPTLFLTFSVLYFQFRLSFLWRSGSGEGIYSYINHGCDEQLTAEEVSEMVRISQVPFTQFGSATALSNVSFG